MQWGAYDWESIYFCTNYSFCYRLGNVCESWIFPLTSFHILLRITLVIGQFDSKRCAAIKVRFIGQSYVFWGFIVEFCILLVNLWGLVFANKSVLFCPPYDDVQFSVRNGIPCRLRFSCTNHNMWPGMGLLPCGVWFNEMPQWETERIWDEEQYWQMDRKNVHHRLAWRSNLSAKDLTTDLPL